VGIQSAYFDVVVMLNPNAMQIQENRLLTTKFDELKRQSLFLRSSPDFYKTEWIGDSSTGVNVSINAAIFITLLQNPDSHASYYHARQNDATSLCVVLQ
jgi:hypothetical protein